MIKPTMERLLKLQASIVEQAERLPEYSAFGDKNDLEGERMNVELIQWIIDNFENKDKLREKKEEYEEFQSKNSYDDVLYDRYDTFLFILDFALGESDEYYTLYYDEEDEVLE